MNDTLVRSLAKAISWRVTGTLERVVLVTRDPHYYLSTAL